jgi:hypothetical protein
MSYCAPRAFTVMSSSSHSLTPAPATAAPPFRWLNPLQPSKFRVIVGLGIAAIVLLLINLVTPGALGVSAYVMSVVAGITAYLLAEVLMVLMVAIGPFVGGVYGIYAYFFR